jgi:hypothetical protein
MEDEEKKEVYEDPTKDPQWDPIFQRRKKTDAELFQELVIDKNEYYDED